MGEMNQLVRSLRYRRERASKACEVCHARKVRCDMTENFPCTNCKAFALECKPRQGAARTRKRSGPRVNLAEAKRESYAPPGQNQNFQNGIVQPLPPTAVAASGSGLVGGPTDGPDAVLGVTPGVRIAATDPSATHSTVKSTSGVPLGTANFVTALGAAAPSAAPAGASAGMASAANFSSAANTDRSHLSTLATAVYYPTGVSMEISACESHQHRAEPDGSRYGAHLGAERMVMFETTQPEEQLILEVLGECSNREFFPVSGADLVVARMFGCFLTPTPQLCDHLIGLYFEYIHPQIPVINRRKFLAEYAEDRDKPSLLLRQAMFCTAARVSKHPELRDAEGSSKRTSGVFYRRAKVLFDTAFETDEVNLISAATLLTLGITNPLYFNNSQLDWVHIGVTLAQNLNFHRQLPSASIERQRTQRRIWWSLFRRDMTTSVTIGRPAMIHLEECDVDMISLDDFIGSETEPGSVLDPNSVEGRNILAFMESVKLFKLMTMSIRRQFTVNPGAFDVKSKGDDSEVPLLLKKSESSNQQSEELLSRWVANLPPQLMHHTPARSDHDSTGNSDEMDIKTPWSFMRMVVSLEYYVLMCLIHRSYVTRVFSGDRSQEAVRSTAIAFEAAHTIVRILESFQVRSELCRLPSSCIYTMFCALLILAFEIRLKGVTKKGPHSATRDIEALCQCAEVVSQQHLAASWVVKIADKLKEERFRRRLVAQTVKDSGTMNYENYGFMNSSDAFEGARPGESKLTAAGVNGNAASGNAASGNETSGNGAIGNGASGNSGSSPPQPERSGGSMSSNGSVSSGGSFSNILFGGAAGSGNWASAETQAPSFQSSHGQPIQPYQGQPQGAFQVPLQPGDNMGYQSTTIQGPGGATNPGTTMPPVGTPAPPAASTLPTIYQDPRFAKQTLPPIISPNGAFMPVYAVPHANFDQSPLPNLKVSSPSSVRPPNMPLPNMAPPSMAPPSMATPPNMAPLSMAPPMAQPSMAQPSMPASMPAHLPPSVPQTPLNGGIHYAPSLTPVQPQLHHMHHPGDFSHTIKEEFPNTPDMNQPYDEGGTLVDIYTPGELVNHSVPEILSTLTADLANLTNDVSGSSDDGTAPDTMGFTDWYNFLNQMCVDSL